MLHDARAGDLEQPTLLKGDLTAEVRKLKQQAAADIVVMEAAASRATGEPDWSHEYQIVLNPLVVGQGRTLFEGVQRKLR